MSKIGHIQSVRLSEDNLQWKKASKNLQNFIQSQHLTIQRTYHFPRQCKKNFLNKDKISLMKSLQVIHYSQKQTERQSPRVTSRSKQSNLNKLSKRQNMKSPYQKSVASSKGQSLSYRENSLKDMCVQTQEEQAPIKRRCLAQQNSSLKELIIILQKQILSYSKTISETQNSIENLKGEIKIFKEKASTDNKIFLEIQQKLQKQIQLNKCMEYIIGELNEKVKIQLKNNYQLQLTIEEYKIKEERNLEQTFSQSQSSLSMNSQTFKKQQFNSLFKNNDSIIDALESNILVDDKQNWQLSALDMSCFNKTPNKIHITSSYDQQQRKLHSTNQFQYDEQIDQIILRHKIQINKLKQKIKYYEIENQMLRRKKEISEKNTLQIEELKHRIQRLSQQNKIIKLLQQGKKKNNHDQIEQKKDKNIQKLELSQYKESDYLTRESKNQAAENNLPTQNTQLNQPQKSKKQKQLKVDLTNSCEKQSTSEQKSSIKRKNFLQRKFVRKQRGSPQSSSSLDEDSQISLEFSPERV